MAEQDYAAVLARVRRLSNETDDVVVGVQDGRTDPEPGSPAEIELSQCRVDGHAGVRNAYTMAAMQLASALDHARAVNRLLDDPPNVPALLTVARGAAESSARAAWLLDPGIDARRRCARGVNMRRSSVTEMRKMPFGSRLAVSATEQLEALFKAALACGLVDDLMRGTNGIIEKLPTATDLVRLLLEPLGDNAGELGYRMLSGTVHANPLIISSYVGSVGSDFVVDSFRLDRVETTLIVVLTTFASWRAWKRQAYQFAWARTDVDAWDARLRKALEETIASLAQP